MRVSWTSGEDQAGSCNQISLSAEEVTEWEFALGTGSVSLSFSPAPNCRSVTFSCGAKVKLPINKPYMSATISTMYTCALMIGQVFRLTRTNNNAKH